jgi:hypothetical protein
MLGAAFFQRFVELFQQLALVLGQLDGRFQADVAVQIARVAGAHALDALAAQAKLLAGLRAVGNVDGGLAVERRHLDLAAQRGGGKADRHHAVQIVAVALEDVVLFQTNLDEQIARRPAVGARLAVAGRPDAHAVVNAGGNLHFQRFLVLDLALTVAHTARVLDELAGAAAMRAGLLHAEKALAHLHHTLAVAGAAGGGAGAGLGARAVAGVALVPAGDADLRVLSRGGFFQRDFHRVAQVGAAVHLLTAAPATLLAEDVAKDVAKRLGKTAKAFRPAAHVRVDARVAVLVVGGALLRVGQHLVGLFGLLELDLGLHGHAALVAVGVVLHRQLAISLLDFLIAGVLGNAQDFVIVALGGHQCFSKRLRQTPRSRLRGIFCAAAKAARGR